MVWVIEARQYRLPSPHPPPTEKHMPKTEKSKCIKISGRLGPPASWVPVLLPYPSVADFVAAVMSKCQLEVMRVAIYYKIGPTKYHNVFECFFMVVVLQLS